MAKAYKTRKIYLTEHESKQVTEAQLNKLSDNNKLVMVSKELPTGLIEHKYYLKTINK